MISKRDLLEKIEKLTDRLGQLEAGSTFSVPIVDKDGNSTPEEYTDIFNGVVYYNTIGSYPEYKKLSISQVCRALQDMCEVEITYQEIKGSEGVVIYEKNEKT